uniref:Ig-like domain-containing protein n=1 Tax=Sphaeramia orbicularis TaxID=375764 RepID=A0A673C213_9TELE
MKQLSLSSITYKWPFISFFFSSAGDSDSKSVVQTPPFIMKNPGQSVIFCFHKKSDHTLMLWYQHSPGDTALKLIGYLNYEAVEMEEPYEKQFQITGDLSGSGEKNGSLIIQTTGPVHSAVYYCAASYAQ